jgi:hypothetical protein
VVAATARDLLSRFELDSPVRLIGVGVSSLRRTSEPEPGPAQGALALPI